MILHKVIHDSPSSASWKEHAIESLKGFMDQTKKSEAVKSLVGTIACSEEDAIDTVSAFMDMTANAHKHIVSRIDLPDGTQMHVYGVDFKTGMQNTYVVKDTGRTSPSYVAQHVANYIAALQKNA